MPKTEPAAQSEIVALVRFVALMLYALIVSLLLAVIWLDPIKKSVLRIEKKVNQCQP